MNPKGVNFQLPPAGQFSAAVDMGRTAHPADGKTQAPSLCRCTNDKPALDPSAGRGHEGACNQRATSSGD